MKSDIKELQRLGDALASALESFDESRSSPVQSICGSRRDDLSLCIEELFEIGDEILRITEEAIDDLGIEQEARAANDNED